MCRVRFTVRLGHSLTAKLTVASSQYEQPLLLCSKVFLRGMPLGDFSSGD